MPTFFYGSQVFSCKVSEGAGKGASTNFTFLTGDGKIEPNYTYPYDAEHEKRVLFFF
jgi:hypothetical protein